VWVNHEVSDVAMPRPVVTVTAVGHLHILCDTKFYYWLMEAGV